ncbi:MAG TPA: hypothetical protein VGH88_15580 [Streptosporangiaceae bacterium]|jgi:hypothetical protein
MNAASPAAATMTESREAAMTKLTGARTVVPRARPACWPGSARRKAACATAVIE